jgi:hypothetical protein
MEFKQNIYISNYRKRSERIHSQWREIFIYKNKKLQELIKQINSCSDFIQRIKYFIEIYQVIVLDFDNMIHEFYTVDFLVIVFEKGYEIKDHINSFLEIETKNYKKNDIKYLFNIFNKIYSIYVNKVSNHLLEHLHNKNKNKNINKECPICMENIKPCYKINTYCNHSFHNLCLLKHLINNSSCPLCREKMDLVL